MKDNAFLKFVHLARAIHNLPIFPSLDAVEERILMICAGVWHTGASITVTEIAHMVPGCSERTIYRRLKSLQDKDMLKFRVDEKDRRVKYVEATNLTEKYFTKMDACIKGANA